ncbi:ATP-dependent DNA helicase RecG [Desulfonatronum thiosulfatophilum]|uniref:ATP-dependent DNA helicase RecG n=1 Tax=Desulfonatronum thiosulfatophilum TaxID=617002 RepID=A0A1G6DSS0_9BACT|nr:RNA-binding domain-containing protein [Desulfonatronum thiosulfatophilum]SDB48189.1 ATP-dependent DNA helicase RecG [Desulfonatronum thiosulfatophilum]
MNLPQSENQYVEFKSEKVAAKDLTEEIVAFANGEGGEIWLGVEDDGQVSGLSRTYEADVMNICRGAVRPPLTPEYTEFVVDAKTVARIIIPKGPDRPYATSRDRYLVRVGSTKRIASREELIRLFQASGFFHYDLVPLDQARTAHLDHSAIEEYFSRYRISFSGESEEEKTRLLAASDITDANAKPTVGGLLVFGINPESILHQAGIAFAHFKGLELESDLLDKKIFGGSLPRQVDNALAAIKANIPIGSTITGTRRMDAPHYPDKVFRELLVNAVVHRNYSIIGSQIRVLLFADRIEFLSPGRLPNTVTIEKLSVGTSFARNPLLVRLMGNLGYMDRLGRGLPMVCQEPGKLNKSVTFEEAGEVFRVVLEM